jgi:hypothetical protein
MYKLIKNPMTGETKVVFNTEANLYIPLNAPDNTDYQAYLRWLEAGNTPEPAEENQ